MNRLRVLGRDLLPALSLVVVTACVCCFGQLWKGATVSTALLISLITGGVEGLLLLLLLQISRESLSVLLWIGGVVLSTLFLRSLTAASESPASTALDSSSPVIAGVSLLAFGTLGYALLMVGRRWRSSTAIEATWLILRWSGDAIAASGLLFLIIARATSPAPEGLVIFSAVAALGLLARALVEVRLRLWRRWLNKVIAGGDRGWSVRGLEPGEAVPDRTFLTPRADAINGLLCKVRHEAGDGPYRERRDVVPWAGVELSPEALTEPEDDQR